MSILSNLLDQANELYGRNIMRGNVEHRRDKAEEVAEQQIREGKGIAHEDFWREVESETPKAG